MDTSVAVQFQSSVPAICRFSKCVRQFAAGIFFFAFLLITVDNILAGQMRSENPKYAAAAQKKWSLAFRSLERALGKALEMKG